MNLDLAQLQRNVNVHATRPEFLNQELHYVIAENADLFRFVGWEAQPHANEQKFFCFLQPTELSIPERGIVLKESYTLSTEPLFPVITDCKGFLQMIQTVQQEKVGKAIRQFSLETLENIKNELLDEFDTVETHVVASPQLKHHIFVVDNVEISVAPTMVYLRIKAPFAEHHYHTATEG